MWTTNGCTTRSPRRGGAPDRKTRRSRRPKGGWPQTSKRWKPTSSARDAPGHDLAPSPVARDAGGASHPASQRPGHAAAAQGRAGADARQAGALEAADSDSGAPQLRHVPAHRARPRRAAGRRRGRRGARRHRPVPARPTGARRPPTPAPARRSCACAPGAVACRGGDRHVRARGAPAPAPSRSPSAACDIGAPHPVHGPRGGARDRRLHAPAGVSARSTRHHGGAVRGAARDDHHEQRGGRSGVGELTLSGSGVRVRLPVDVVLPATSVGAWGIGARTAWLGANHPWIGLAGVAGIKGADFSIFGCRTVVAGLSLALGATAGSLNADQTTGSVSLQLLEGFGRAEFALVPRGTVSPVLSLGAGAYRLKSGDNGQTVDHTNLFWSGGVGADVVVTASVIVELRVERQWMRDTNQGHGATLWPLSAGVRAAL